MQDLHRPCTRGFLGVADAGDVAAAACCWQRWRLPSSTPVKVAMSANVISTVTPKNIPMVSLFAADVKALMSVATKDDLDSVFIGRALLAVGDNPYYKCPNVMLLITNRRP